MSVRFTADTIDPPPTEKCFCCGHRNIIPQIRALELCMECFKQTCQICMNSMYICKDCELELFAQSPPDE